MSVKLWMMKTDRRKRRKKKKDMKKKTILYICVFLSNKNLFVLKRECGIYVMEGWPVEPFKLG